MSYNELFGLGSHSEDASLEGWWPLQDNAASTAVDDVSSNGNDGTLVGGDNTADITTTGPNNWLTAALAFDGAADYVTCPAVPTAYPFTFAARVRPTAVAAGYPIALCDASATTVYWQILTNSSLFFFAVRRNTTSITTNSGEQLTNGQWVHLSIVFPNATTVTMYLDGVQVFHDAAVTSVPFTTDVDAFLIGTSRVSSPFDFFEGDIAEAVLLRRVLDSDEHAELEAGPEPINTVAPALSGTELVGETLTATSGTWALDAPFSGGSNGTVTYSYQWTRSDDDAGTGEADISGATSSTYVLTAADAGKYVRCRVRGTNDGGFDADADTNTAMSGKIATTALLANLVAHYKLDETSGTVVRNEVRTLLLDDDFDSGSTSGTYGDVPTGWAEYRASSPATQVTTYNAGSDTLTLELDGEGTGAGIGGIQKTSFLTVGNRYVLRTRFRVTEAVTGGPFLVVSAGSNVFYDLTTPTVGEWLTVDVNLGSASSTTFTYGVQVTPNTEAATVEIDYITIYEENAGTYQNSPTLGDPGPAPGSRAVAFNGTSQYASNIAASTAAFFSGTANSVAFWAKMDSGGPAFQYVLNDAGGVFGIQFRSGLPSWLSAAGTIAVGTNAVQLGATDYRDGVWHHFALVRTGNDVLGYADGTLTDTESLSSPNSSTTATAGYIAARGTPTSYFDGSLYDVRLWDRVLTAAEVYAVYQEGLLKPLSRTSLGLGIGL